MENVYSFFVCNNKFLALRRIPKGVHLLLVVLSGMRTLIEGYPSKWDVTYRTVNTLRLVQSQFPRGFILFPGVKYLCILQLL